MDTLAIATLAGLLVLVASMVSVELGVSAAIIEIILGLLAGNFLGMTSTPWIDFLAQFASVLLTFLAGAEVDPSVLRQKSRQAGHLTTKSLGRVSGRTSSVPCASGAGSVAGVPADEEQPLIVHDEYPPGVPSWVDTEQPDPEAAARFYGGLFGWKFADQMAAESPGRYFLARLRGLDVAAVGSDQDRSVTFAVDDADAAADRAMNLGGSVEVPPFDAWMVRVAVLRDPQGAAFTVNKYDPGRAG